MEGKSKGDVLVDEDLPSEIEIDMDESTVEDIGLLFGPRFTVHMRKLAKGLKSVKLKPGAENFLLNASRH